MAARLRLLQIPLVAALFAFLLWQLDVGALGDALRGADPWYVSAAVAVNAPVGLLFWSRSHLVLVRLGHRIAPSLLLPIAVLGNVAGAFTPASAGELLRGHALAGHASVTAQDSFALVLFERGLSTYYMVAGGAVAAAFMWLPAPIAWVAAAAGLASMAAPFAAVPVLRRLSRTAEPDGAGFFSRARGVAGRLADICSDVPLVAIWTAQTLAIFALNALQFWLLARGVAGGISYHDAWLAFSLPTLAGLVSLIPLGLGAFDGSIAAVLGRVGLTLEQGTVVAILVRAAISLPMLLLAFASFLYLQRRDRGRETPGVAGTRQPG